jgi:F-type H+-transporting ATPase subunit gamma
VEQEQVLKARISSLTELRGLFQALRALAANRLQEAQGALTGIRAYAAIIAEALADALALDGEGIDRAEGKGAALIVVCSEHGFAGGFNARLLEAAQARRVPGEMLVVMGKRGGVTATESGMAPDVMLPMATHVAGVAATVHDLAQALAGHATAGVVYGAYQRGGGFAPAYRRVLPPDLPVPPKGNRRAPPLAQLPPADLLRALDREYLFAALSQAMMESFASENAARLRVMEAADHSIADKLEVLGRAENDLRQEAITSELLDVVTGSEAIMATGH